MAAGAAGAREAVEAGSRTSLAGPGPPRSQCLVPEQSIPPCPLNGGDLGTNARVQGQGALIVQPRQGLQKLLPLSLRNLGRVKPKN